MIPRTSAVPAWRLSLRSVLAACVGLTLALALAGEACAQPASFGQVVERPIPGDPVMIDSGQIAGKLLPTGVKAYFGVPFAAAPVQKLRWREPQPVPPWRGVLQADRFAPECIQASRSWSGSTAVDSRSAPPAWRTIAVKLSRAKESYTFRSRIDWGRSDFSPFRP
jgi:hypothetical protein